MPDDHARRLDLFTRIAKPNDVKFELKKRAMICSGQERGTVQRRLGYAMIHIQHPENLDSRSYTNAEFDQNFRGHS